VSPWSSFVSPCGSLCVASVGAALLFRSLLGLAMCVVVTGFRLVFS
jgi:hypothetical protein